MSTVTPMTSQFATLNLETVNWNEYKEIDSKTFLSTFPDLDAICWVGSPLVNELHDDQLLHNKEVGHGYFRCSSHGGFVIASISKRELIGRFSSVVSVKTYEKNGEFFFTAYSAAHRLDGKRLYATEEFTKIVQSIVTHGITCSDPKTVRDQFYEAFEKACLSDNTFFQMPLRKMCYDSTTGNEVLIGGDHDDMIMKDQSVGACYLRFGSQENTLSFVRKGPKEIERWRIQVARDENDRENNEIKLKIPEDLRNLLGVDIYKDKRELYSLKDFYQLLQTAQNKKRCTLIDMDKVLPKKPLVNPDLKA